MLHLLTALWNDSSYKGIMSIPYSSHFFLRSAWRYRLGVAVRPHRKFAQLWDLVSGIFYCGFGEGWEQTELQAIFGVHGG